MLLVQSAVTHILLPLKHHLEEIRRREKKRKNREMTDLIYLLSRRPSEDKGGKHREGVSGVGWPALNGGPHGEAEEGDRLW